MSGVLSQYLTVVYRRSPVIPQTLLHAVPVSRLSCSGFSHREHGAEGQVDARSPVMVFFWHAVLAERTKKDTRIKGGLQFY